jgi:hypothetical protein
MLGLRTLVPLLATAITLVVPAEATTSYYVGASNEAAFNTAVGGLTLLDPSLTFASGDLGTNGLFNASGTGINFLGFDDFNYPTIPENFTVNTGKLTDTNAGEHITINFPAATIYAFGFHFTVTTGTTANLCVELTVGGCDYNFGSVPSSSSQFFGVVSDAPIIAPLYIRDQGTLFTTVLPNFEAYGANPVPEPRTMLLVGLGLVILPLARRKPAAGPFR